MSENSVPDSPTHPGPAATVSAAVAAALTVGLLFGILDALLADLALPVPLGWHDTLGCYAAAVMGYCVVGAIALVLAALVLHPLLRRLCARARLRRLLILGFTAGLFVEIELRLRPLVLSTESAPAIERLLVAALWILLAAVGGVTIARGLVRLSAPVHAVLRGCAVLAIVGGFLFVSGEEELGRGRGVIDEGNRELPNVLLVVADGLRPDRLGCYGLDEGRTPHTDSVGARGVVVEGCFAQAPTIAASLRSMTTGLYPRRHEEAGGPPLPEGRYTTAAFLGDSIPAGSETVSGWATVSGPSTHHDLVTTEGSWSRFRAQLLWRIVENDLLRRLDPDRTTRLARDWLRTSRSLRWFAMVHLGGREVASGAEPTGAAAIDERIGELLAVLEEQDLVEETVVVITAAIGPEGEDVDALRRENLHVPLILANTRLLPHGARVEGTVETIDIVPTLLDLLDLAQPSARSKAEVDGRSFLDAVLGAQRGELASYRPKEVAVAEGPLRVSIHDRNGTLVVPRALLDRHGAEGLLAESGVLYYERDGDAKEGGDLLPEQRVAAAALWAQLRRWNSNEIEPTGVLAGGDPLPPGSLANENEKEEE